ncbi:response regulator [Chryseolinea sp. H1M3-3]|jgi:CheY-like chemotaxis protein|uniref:response regulator n=1 Tax=Chryseolinea sp. H1M3-3 TaxID=3034144 RepID=UPI0023EAD294|nr:response regulator [Chryseolinea sp. H1M3-3]
MESLGPHQILFVEADSANTIVAKQLLTGWGLHVSIAKNGKEAIELTKTNIFDLILMALQLNDIDGIETARIIRRLGDQFQHVPIIGHSADPITADLKGNELTDFILNPFDKTELYNKLKNHLDKGQPDIVMQNLDRCTDGDIEFRRELAQLLANNIIELMTNIDRALKNHDPQVFTRAVHKTKTTLSILNDADLTEDIKIVQAKMKESEPLDLDRYVERLTNRCRKTINILNTISAQ